jgi:uncharacterized membrane protein YhfC
MQDETVSVIIMTVIILLFLTIGGYFFNKAQCDAKWEGSTFSHKYLFIGGCMVQTPDKGWMPAENVRNID